ncbi:MAG TPA: PD-(D/E)XK nuclease family protein [Planctomycetota bacterium]
MFLGWEQPVLPCAARWILAQLGSELGDVLVAVPGARAARRLRELLAQAAPPVWVPPRVLTQGRLVDELVRLEQPPAGRLVRTLAWERALSELPPAERAHLQRPRPGAGEARERLRLAETVRALHGELAPEGKDFESLARDAWGAELDSEAARWRVLARAQADYRRRIAALGLCDPHEGRARAIAAGAVDTTRRVVLVGVADMNHLLARLIEAVAGRASVLVAAPEAEAAAFDALGRLRSEVWSTRDLPLPLADWRVAEKPVDQAETVRAVLDEWHGTLAPEELVLGVADESVVPYLERQLEDCGVGARRAAGTAVERTRPVRLLRALARYLARRGFAELAALARDPDLARSLGNDPDAPARLDRYHLQHLPWQVGEWLGTRESDQATRAFHDRLEQSLADLAGTEPRPLSEWADPLRTWLARVYPAELDEALEPERVLAEALRLVGEVLGELEEVPPSLALSALHAPEALELLLRGLRGLRVPPPPAETQPGAVELVGWLDLPLDDAPALILTGFNEGRVPEAPGAHAAFLPDSRRTALGLPGDLERLARDVHAATVILSTRARRVFVTARRSAEGDPLVPSRLAFHVPPAEVPERVLRFLPQGDHLHAAPAGDEDAGRSFACPVLPGWVAPRRLRVSAFRTFLSSPYQFYLEHVLGLETLDDRTSELDPRRFGTLAHDALEDLAAGPHDSADAAEVAGFLVERLRARAAAEFGARPLPAVALQVAQLEHRLRLFAVRQAERAAEGWRIHAVEWKPGEPVWLDVDGTPIELSGKLDRVDVHPDGRWAILDYKTGDRKKSPRDAHRKKDKQKSWIDLQLPLYRELGRGLGLAGEPELGYAWIAKEEHETGFFAGDFTPEELDEALAEARRVVRCVRAGQFGVPGRPPYDEILKAIFGLSTLGGEGEEGEA